MRRFFNILLSFSWLGLLSIKIMQHNDFKSDMIIRLFDEKTSDRIAFSFWIPVICCYLSVSIICIFEVLGHRDPFWRCFGSGPNKSLGSRGLKTYLKLIPCEALSCGSNWIQLSGRIRDNPNPSSLRVCHLGLWVTRHVQYETSTSQQQNKQTVNGKHWHHIFIKRQISCTRVMSQAPAEVINISSIDSTCVVLPRLGHKLETILS